MKRKGQGALEYLMTYGWALLIVVVVGAALFAMGVFSPQTRETCTGFAYFTYSEHQYVATGSLAISLINGNQDIIVASVNWDGVNMTSVSPTAEQSAGNQFTIKASTGPAKTRGDHYGDNVVITYNTPGIAGKVDRAKCTGRVA